MSVKYRIERKNDVRTRGPGTAPPTETERSFTVEALGGAGNDVDAEAEFRAWLTANAPTDAFGNPVADDGGVELEENEDSLRRLWTARVKYAKPNDAEKEGGDDEMSLPFGTSLASFSTSGGSATTKRSLATVAYPVGGSVVDFGGGIGWNGEEFEGCETVAPNFAFELRGVAPGNFEAYFGSFAEVMSNLTGTVNGTRFLDFLPGTVLFHGVTQGSVAEQADGSRVWTLNYSFSASPHVYLNVGGVQVFKPGWGYFWTLTEKSLDPETGAVVPFVRAAYVEQVYRYADFSLLDKFVR